LSVEDLNCFENGSPNSKPTPNYSVNTKMKMTPSEKLLAEALLIDSSDTDSI